MVRFAAITDPARRLRELLTTVVQAVRPLAPSVHLSLLGDRNDPRVRDAVGRVNQARLELLTRTYRELGLPPDRAVYRAHIAYAAILGLATPGTNRPGLPALRPTLRRGGSSLPAVMTAGAQLRRAKLIWAQIRHRLSTYCPRGRVSGFKKPLNCMFTVTWSDAIRNTGMLRACAR